jgi:hypothetical protein
MCWPGEDSDPQRRNVANVPGAGRRSLSHHDVLVESEMRPRVDHR